MSKSENTSAKIHSQKPIRFAVRHNLPAASSSTHTALEISYSLKVSSRVSVHVCMHTCTRDNTSNISPKKAHQEQQAVLAQAGSKLLLMLSSCEVEKEMQLFDLCNEI